MEKLMPVILIVSSKQFFARNTLIFTQKGEKRPSLDTPAPLGFYLYRQQWVNVQVFLFKTGIKLRKSNLVSANFEPWSRWRYDGSRYSDQKGKILTLP